MDSLLTSRQTGSLAEQFKVAETAAAARVFNQMYYLPTLLKQMEDHMAEMEAVKLKAMGSQEPGGLAGVTNMKIGSYAESNLKTARTLEETLRERNDRRKGALDAV